MVGATWRVRFWRVPRAEVPPGQQDRQGWLHAQWRAVDAFAGGHDGEPTLPRHGPGPTLER